MLQELLESYNPRFSEEKETKRRMLDFLNNENAFERSNLEGHFTASSWITNKDDTKIILMNHKKLGIWIQPGGHCDGDKDTLAVAMKEANEETGIIHIVPVTGQIFDIDIHRCPEYKGVPEHLHYDVRFHLRVLSDEEGIPNDESEGLKWIPKDPSMLGNTHRGLIRMFNKWCSIDI